MTEQTELEGFLVGGILPLSIEAVQDFVTSLKGEDFVPGAPQIGQKSSLEILLENKKHSLYEWLEPEDLGKMWFSTQDNPLFKGNRSYAEVFTDSRMKQWDPKTGKMIPDPDHTVAFYYDIVDNEHGNAKKELVFAYVGSKVDVVIAHRSTCCKEYSLTIEGTLGGRPVRGSLDSLSGTMPTCKGAFLDDEGNSKFHRIPSIEQASLLIEKNPSLLESIKAMLSDFNHTIQHAADYGHACSGLQVSGPAKFHI